MVAIAAHFPTQRLFESGWKSLSDMELVALVVGHGISEGQALRDAQRLLEVVGSAAELGEITWEEFHRAGWGRRKALAILAAVALRSRIQTNPLSPGQPFRSSLEIFHHFRPQVEGLKKECFWCLLLDGKNRILRVVRVSEGSLTSSLVHPREVFRPAIREAAAGVLFVHNHPSGDPAPSQEDIQITKRLVEVGKIVGIRALDHVIIGAHRYFSFVDQGLF
ncbi:MAG: DNA repair protein RadC [Acidobacteria bacterium]|nr:DNA repair protein RadC [Acidobacteriota bacterium]